MLRFANTLRRFGQFGCQELTRLAELEANGQTWFDSLRAIIFIAEYVDRPYAPLGYVVRVSGNDESC